MTPQGLSKKQTVITRLYAACKERGEMTFDNDDVKQVCAAVGFANPLDATKWDTSAALPDALAADDVFVAHLGKGRHQFVAGIDIGYHTFEEIPENRRCQWYYRRSMLNSINTSESSIPFAGYNQRIIHDFLYGDVTVSPNVHFSSYMKFPLNFRIGSDEIAASSVPVVIDFTAEHNGSITVFEAQNGEPADFNVFRLYNPFRYYSRVAEDKPVSSIQCCYLLRKDARLRLYLYSFADPQSPESIRLERNAEYALVEQ